MCIIIIKECSLFDPYQRPNTTFFNGLLTCFSHRFHAIVIVVRGVDEVVIFPETTTIGVHVYIFVLVLTFLSTHFRSYNDDAMPACNRGYCNHFIALTR